MNEGYPVVAYLLYMAAALYLGVLTSISPCPLATNIAAISYIGRKVEDSRLVINAGLLYTLGRCLLYLGLAVLVTTMALSIPAVSIFLQKYMHLVVGPILLILGMFLVGLITFTGGGTMMSERMQKRIDAMGIWGALPLGVLFAVSFCPPSAAWFVGVLTLIMGAKAESVTIVLANIGITLPEASPPGSTIVLPLIYGIGTALPVLVVAFLLAYSAQSVGKAYNVLSKVEWWARMITGSVFVLVGILFCLEYCFEVPIISRVSAMLRGLKS
ncbi:MAG: aromatic aminobenezylarsenical efflux permease ArsG family transporter [Planctomycetota bacterium]|jgi:cytochrome c biogenesis protein CcdA